MEIIRQRIVDINTVIVGYLDTTSVDSGEVSGLLPMHLLGASTNQRYQGFVSGQQLLGEVNTIQLVGIMGACDSTGWDFKILTINDLSGLETIHEMVFYDDISKSFSDFSLTNFYIQNEDDPIANYLYAYVDNTAGSGPTGNINIVLYYKPVY
jgi:hypothetical protein